MNVIAARWCRLASLVRTWWCEVVRRASLLLLRAASQCFSTPSVRFRDSLCCQIAWASNDLCCLLLVFSTAFAGFVASGVVLLGSNDLEFAAPWCGSIIRVRSTSRRQLHRDWNLDADLRKVKARLSRGISVLGFCSIQRNTRALDTLVHLAASRLPRSWWRRNGKVFIGVKFGALIDIHEPIPRSSSPRTIRSSSAARKPSPSGMASSRAPLQLPC